MRSLWNHFGVILGSLWGHFGITLGSLWDHFGGTLGHFGITLGLLWDHFGSPTKYKDAKRRIWQAGQTWTAPWPNIKLRRGFLVYTRVAHRGWGETFSHGPKRIGITPQGLPDRSLWRWVGLGVPGGPRGPHGAHEGDLSPGHHRGRGRNFP